MKVITIRIKKTYILFFSAVFAISLLGVYGLRSRYRVIPVMSPVSQKVIVLDPGHGGYDPGKEGKSSDEKDINLSIALILQNYLEQGGAVVFITRNDDKALGSSKKTDMKNRTSLADECEADIFISIHQNSFPSSSVKGAQVFYHNSSASGKLLAETIQEKLRTYVDSGNTRKAKANSDYYILRVTSIPAAIIECGFLSNPSEEKNLNTKEYQEKIAWAIYLGISEYFLLSDLQEE